jgi:hypothetical protein
MLLRHAAEPPLYVIAAETNLSKTKCLVLEAMANHYYDDYLH